MSMIGDAANAAGKKAAAKAAQKGAEKAAAKSAGTAAQKGASAAATKATSSAAAGATTAAQKGASGAAKAAGGVTQKGADAAAGAGKLGQQTDGARKLGEQRAAQSAADKNDPLGGAGRGPKGALKENTPAREKTPEQKLEDAKRAEKTQDKPGKLGDVERDGSGKAIEKPEGTKSLREKAKEAKKLSDERKHEEEQTLGGKAKGVVKDVGGEAVAGALGGAAAGAAAGGVGAAPGAAIGAAKGAAKGILKNKTTRKGLIFAILAPFFAMALVVVFVIGSMQSMLISSVAANQGGKDTTDLAAASGIEEEDVTKAYQNTTSSDYPWTLTLAWNDIMKNSADANLKEFPAQRFAIAMREVDKEGYYRDMIYQTEIISEEDGGGLKIPQDEKTGDDKLTPESQHVKDAQAKIREVWVEALVQAGKPESGQDQPQDAARSGSNTTFFGDKVSTAASSQINQKLSGVESVYVAERTLPPTTIAVGEAGIAGTLRPYVVVATAQTEAITTEGLDEIAAKIGANHSIVFVNAYDGSGTKDWIAESNQVLADWIEEHREQARLADWASTANGHDDWFDEDKVTPKSEDALNAYANMISSAVGDLPAQKTTPGLTEKQAEQIYDRAVTLALGVGLNSCTAPTTENPGDTTGNLNALQEKYAKDAIGVAKGMFPGNDEQAKQAATIVLMTIAVESGFKNYANSGIPESMSLPHDAVGSDHDSVGLVQQRPSAGWGDIPGSTWAGGQRAETVKRLMTPSFSLGKFITKLVELKDWMTGPRGVSAQNVQISAFPDRYAEHESEAQMLVSKFWSEAAAISPDPGLGWNGAPVTGGDNSNSLGGCGGTLGTGTMGVGAPPIPEGMSYIGSVYGPRDCSDGISSCFHKGLDFSGISGTQGTYCTKEIPISSISDGIVQTFPDPGYGANNAVVIKYSEELSFYYLHMNMEDVKVKTGDTVKAGQQIGLMGSHGQSTGCHLHVETHVNGEKVDPAPIIEQGFGVKLPEIR